MRDRYDEASEEVGLYRDLASAVLRSVAIAQPWREHLLAQLIVNRELTSRAVFMVVGPRLNRRGQAAFRVYEAELVNAGDETDDRVRFSPITLEDFIQAIAAAGARELASAHWERYCDFHCIYRLSMEELAGATSPVPARSSGTSAENSPASPTRRTLPSVRPRTAT